MPENTHQRLHLPYLVRLSLVGVLACSGPTAADTAALQPATAPQANVSDSVARESDPTERPAVESAEPERLANAEKEEASRRDAVGTCALPVEEEFLGFEWARRFGFRSVCLTAHWVDSLFGDQAFDPKEGRINGSVSWTTERRQGGDWSNSPRLRASVKLPNVSKKVDLFFDRDKESKTIAGESAALHPEGNLRNEENTSQIGIGYQLYKGLADLANIRFGVRVRAWKPEPFASSRYAVSFADNSIDRWNFAQTLFWKRGEGFGETSSLDYERHLGGPLILRWGSSVTLSEITDGLRWSSALSVFHALSADKALQWSYGANGETKAAAPLTNHGPRVSYRQRLKQRWLIFEAYTGIDNLKNDDLTRRVQSSYVGAKIEAHFNTP